MSARPSGLIKRDLLAVVREFKNVEFDPKFNDLHELALIHGRVEELEMGLARAKQENEAKAQAQATYGWDDAHKLMETQERGGGASASSPKTKNRDKKGKGKKTDEDEDAHSHDGECFHCFLEKLGTRPEGLDALDALEKTLSVSEEQNGNHNGGNVKMTDLEPFLEAVGKSFPQLAESAAEVSHKQDMNTPLPDPSRPVGCTPTRHHFTNHPPTRDLPLTNFCKFLLTHRESRTSTTSTPSQSPTGPSTPTLPSSAPPWLAAAFSQIRTTPTTGWLSR